jgi:hypothetical protein
MKKAKNENIKEIRAEYDFDYSKAVRGKYTKKLLKEKSNVIVLDPDIALSFQESASVNEALRSLLKFRDSTIGFTKRSSRRIKTS